jgi:hypothetical protein
VNGEVEKVTAKDKTVFSEQNLMNKVLAYALLVLFSAIILSASFLTVVCPQMLWTYQFRAGFHPNHPESNYCVLYAVIAAILYADKI